MVLVRSRVSMTGRVEGVLQGVSLNVNSVRSLNVRPRRIVHCRVLFTSVTQFCKVPKDVLKEVQSKLHETEPSLIPHKYTFKYRCGS